MHACILVTEQLAAVVRSHRYAHQDRSNQMLQQHRAQGSVRSENEAILPQK